MPLCMVMGRLWAVLDPVSVYLCVVCSRVWVVLDFIYLRFPFVGIVDCSPH